MELIDDRVVVWVARIDARSDVVARAWSVRSKAVAWVEDSVDGTVAWDEPQGSSSRETLHGTVDGGGTDVEVRRVEVQDPVSLAQRYPSELPAARYIGGDE